MKRQITRRSFDSIGKEPTVADTTRRRFKSNKSTTTVLNNVLFNPLNSRIATSLLRRVNDSVINKFKLNELSETAALKCIDNWVGEVPANEVFSFIDGDTTEDFTSFGVDKSLVQDIRELYPLGSDEGLFIGKDFSLINIKDEKLNEIANAFLDSVIRVCENVKAGSLLQDKIKTMHIRGQKYLITGGGHRRAVALAYVDGWQSSQDIEVEATAETSLLDLYTENNSKESESKFERLLAQHRLYSFLKAKGATADEMRAKLQLSRSWYFKLIKILKRPVVIELIKKNPSILDSVGLESISKIIDSLSELEHDEAKFTQALEQSLSDFRAPVREETVEVSYETSTAKPSASKATIEKSVKKTNQLFSKVLKEQTSFSALFELIFPNENASTLSQEQQHEMLRSKLESLITKS
ncbi:hypothetical protein DS2_15414 [Catenovulum agarivorans DS-2]|uniref:ParB/Sulfiredoxin domain-containing protein n=1 Tax=Catenovulum agarivorans DS-2 TaxID=1328313 RepID=W7QTU8_9ALTE|nr:hypothetical protein [Catenovulum agarivorans]EWH08860.1 hypothetical protein DS2_15414 [Catenovulum agarivorans DS-2]